MYGVLLRTRAFKLLRTEIILDPGSVSQLAV